MDEKEKIAHLADAARSVIEGHNASDDIECDIDTLNGVPALYVEAPGGTWVRCWVWVAESK